MGYSRLVTLNKRNLVNLVTFFGQIHEYSQQQKSFPIVLKLGLCQK